ncbi:MAG: hypothetical protein P8J32_05920 [bacterium]|nr:hypothetical protein [bacterium]
MRAKDRPRYKELEKALNELNLKVNSEVVVDLRKKTTKALDEAEDSVKKEKTLWDSVKENIVPLGLIIGAVTLYALDKSGGGWLLFFLLLHGASNYDW